MQNKIYPCIWCNNNAKEMAEYYSSVFPNTKIIDENPVVVMIAIEGQKIMLLNGGDIFKPNPSISLMGVFQNAEEVEALWAKLIPESTALMDLGDYPFSKKYGWLADKYGVNWQLYTGESGGTLEKYVPTLMFNGNNNGKAKEAIDLYTRILPDSKVQGIMEYAEGGGDAPGNVQHAQFDIAGTTIMCMDSSYDHKFNFTEGVSLVVNCKDQQEIDKYWNGLTADGGAESQCGWLKDKYGLSWQVIPENIGTLVQKPEAMQAMMQMKKIVIADLENAGKN